MINRIIFLISVLIAATIVSHAQCIDLAGDWNAKLSNGQEASVSLPGTLDMAGVGITDTLKPAMEKPQLLRLTRKVSYIGPCTYSRFVDIPENMSGKPLRLVMERVLWKSTLKIDGKSVKGENLSLNSPHRFDISPLPAGKHLFEITVDNRRQRDISFSNLCHSYTDDTQTIWNGVLGSFSLCVVPEVDIESLRVYPDISNQNISVDVVVRNSTRKKICREIVLTVTEKSSGHIAGVEKMKYCAPVGVSNFKTTVGLDSCRLWSEFDPFLYALEVNTKGSSAQTLFGMREVRSEGRDLSVNGKKIFLRGTLDCCVFPLTGVPPTDKAAWAKEMETLKEWGFNHIRFHSWCPPEAAFETADSLGLYLQTELPVWSLNIGDDQTVSDFLNDEFRNMSESYGNHPSWIMSTCGNELQHDFNVLNALVRQMREYDPRHIYAATSFTFEKGHGGHAEPYDQFLITQWTDDGWVRGQGVFDNETPSFDKNYIKSMTCVSVPLVSHEIGQYAVYPDICEIDKYTGILEPLNFKAIRNDLESKKLLSKAPAYLNATSKFAKILYKEEIERALKTPGFSGFQLLGIQDFPGQGTALVGLLDAFWDAKGNMNGEDFSKFNSPVVPLASFDKAVYTSDEEFSVSAIISNFGEDDIENSHMEWQLSDDKGFYRSGSIDVSMAPQGTVTEIGGFRTSFDGFQAPSKLTLTLKISGTGHENIWNIWLYPVIDKVEAGNVAISSDYKEVRKILERGGRVLYMPPHEKINGIESKFLPVFWSPVHFPKQAGVMGVLAEVSHPALKGFPNDGHSDWQWWHSVKNARIMDLDSIVDCTTGNNIEPIVGVIDNFFRNRRLGYMFEAKCGNGSLLVSSINLCIVEPEIKSLFQGALDYLNSPDFDPSEEISFETLESISRMTSPVSETNETSIYE